jgi:DNA-binding NarL/FixJ family response regulator
VRKIRILLVGCPALAHVIRHLFNDRPEFEVVGSLRGLRGLAQQADRLRPELIVANVKPIGTGISAVVVAIRTSSPLSRLILICPTSDLIVGGGRCGADACLDQEKLVRRLVPTASTLSAHVSRRAGVPSV